jgi:nucleotide-binding universal stress UspA family protein
METKAKILVAFSATSIHKKLAMQALDLAAKDKADLIILSVRDMNIAEKVARLTHDLGFLGEKVVDRLEVDINADREEVISKRLARLEKEAEKRGISFETIRVKGPFVETVVEVIQRYNVDTILVEKRAKIVDDLKKNAPCEVIAVVE